jgi:Tfp pilus assembly protein PilF
MPGNYQAHNVLAEFLEKKGKPAEALAEFRKSMEIEGNQPPTGQAIEQLERTLGLRK